MSCLPSVLIIAVFNSIIGGLCCDYVLRTWFAINVPMWADVLIGLVAAEILIPITFISWILSFFLAIPFITGVA